VPRRRQTGEIGLGRTGDKANARTCWQMQHIEQPANSHFFQFGSNGRKNRNPCILIPRASQPVGCQRCRE